MRALATAVLLLAAAAGPAAAQNTLGGGFSGNLDAGYGSQGGASVATPGSIGSGLTQTAPGQVLPGTTLPSTGAGAGLDLTRGSSVPSAGNALPLVTGVDIGRPPVSSRGGDLTYGR